MPDADTERMILDKIEVGVNEATKYLIEDLKVDPSLVDEILDYFSRAKLVDTDAPETSANVNIIPVGEDLADDFMATTEAPPDAPPTEKSPDTLRSAPSSTVTDYKPNVSVLEAPDTISGPDWDDEDAPPTIRNPSLRNAMVRVQHSNFLTELKKAAAIHNPYVMAAMIAKYSDQIEDIDFESSMKLLAIAEGIFE